MKDEGVQRKRRNEGNMTIGGENLIESIMASLDRISHMKIEDIPNIDLYMDQVTTLMEEKLRPSTRYPGEDKILTKTMINNYAKNNLLPPPVKKKYSKEHVLVLIFIYYYKGILSINDIQTLLSPLTDKYFGKNADFNLESIYNEVFSMEAEEVEVLKKEVMETYQRAQQTFQDAPAEDVEFLRKFSFICLLSYDVYVKKLMIEKLIDELRESTSPGKNGERHEKKEK